MQLILVALHVAISLSGMFHFQATILPLSNQMGTLKIQIFTHSSPHLGCTGSDCST